jgi:type IV pilus assembly protein PilO
MALEINFEDKPWWQAVVWGLVLAVAFALVGEYVYPNFQQKRKDIEAARSHLSSLTAEIEKGRAAERKLPQFREEVKKLELDLQKLLKVLPPEKDTEELIKQVETLVHQGDFTLQSFRTGEPIPKEFYKEYPMYVAITGTYHNLALFFSRMGNFKRIINVEDLKIAALTGVPGKTISSTFTAKTYIYTGGDVVTEAPKPGAAKPNPVARGAQAIKKPTGDVE